MTDEDLTLVVDAGLVTLTGTPLRGGLKAIALAEPPSFAAVEHRDRHGQTWAVAHTFDPLNPGTYWARLGRLRRQVRLVSDLVPAGYPRGLHLFRTKLR